MDNNISDREMALLHRYGWAKEFEVEGKQILTIKWKKGERYLSGAEVTNGDTR